MRGAQGKMCAREMTTVTFEDKKFDLKFCKTPQGIFLLLEMVFCFFGFILAIGDPTKVVLGHAFFLITICGTLCCAITGFLIHICGLKSSKRFRTIDWNKMGIGYSALFAIIMMVSSSIMVDNAFASRSHRAAGIFGFFGFTTFFAHVCWECRKYFSKTLSTINPMTASIFRRNSKATTSQSSDDECEDPLQPGIQGIIRSRTDSPTIPSQGEQSGQQYQSECAQDNDSSNTSISSTDGNSQQWNITIGTDNQAAQT